MSRLAGQVAVITGGASGIGAATARLFVREGARVVVGDVDEDGGLALAEELGKGAAFLRADVRREDDVAGLVEHALELHGHLDCMFNNAGVGGGDAGIADTPVEGFDELVSVHLRGTVLGMKHAARAMCPRGRGAIVNMGSVAGMIAGFGSHAYGAAKAAVIHLTRTVAMELGESGVRVNCVCPGLVATPIFARSLGLEGEQVDRSAEALTVAFSEVQPVRRAGQPEDVAQAVLWLAGDESGFVTGHTLVVDGGMVCGLPWRQSRRGNRRLRSALDADAGQE